MVERTVGAQLSHVAALVLLPLISCVFAPPFMPSRERTVCCFCSVVSRSLIACVSASWCFSAGLVLDCASPLAVHGPGFASLPGPPIARLSAPSVFACVLLGFGSPGCLPHHFQEGGCCVTGWVHDCSVILHSGLLAS